MYVYTVRVYMFHPSIKIHLNSGDAIMNFSNLEIWGEERIIDDQDNVGVDIFKSFFQFGKVRHLRQRVCRALQENHLKKIVL